MAMNNIAHQIERPKSGFTLIELLVVISILALLAAFLMPALGRAVGAARTTKDKSQMGGIHNAMLLYASSNEGNLPLPSVVGNEHTDTIDHDYSNTTANLMSLMLGRNYFTTATLISPVESNPNIEDINAETLTYDYDGIDGNTVLWDTEHFKADISDMEELANNSYAHQALWGERVRLKWNSGASSSDIILSNRGPENGEQTNSPSYTDSNTLKFHGSEEVWIGVVVSGDGSVRTVDSVFPEGIVYQPLNGAPLGPDNLFNPDWGDVDPTDGTKSGDNWLIICKEADEETDTMPASITAVWD
jgi:prepilin-type N-terminal cleavage/methylation domain-containing protein